MKRDDPQRRAYEARVWRLAFLLTGGPEGAGEVIRRILQAQPDVLRVEAARLDRLVVLHSREWSARRRSVTAASPPLEPAGAQALSAALSLNHQLLEAWVLARVDGMEGLSVSRAMDCSNTAAANHLAEADREMGVRLGEGLAAGLESLRRSANALDPRGALVAVREEARTRGRRRLLLTLIGIGALAAGLWIAGVSGLLPTSGLYTLWSLLREP